jgi:hypothetical protein
VEKTLSESYQTKDEFYSVRRMEESSRMRWKWELVTAWTTFNGSLYTTIGLGAGLASKAWLPGRRPAAQDYYTELVAE